MEKNRLLFGTKVFNHDTKEQGLIIYTWKNSYADLPEVDFATCVDINGKKYNTPMEFLEVIE